MTAAHNPCWRGECRTACYYPETCRETATAPDGGGLTEAEWTDILATLPESPENALGWELSLVRRTVERILAARSTAPDTEAIAAALLPIRRYAESRAFTERARGRFDRDWLDLLVLCDRAAAIREGSDT